MRNFRTYISILFLTLLVGTTNAQFVNKGKIITISDGSVMTIQADAVNEGAIRNGGTIYLSGDWTNINSYLSQNGKFVLNGTSVQTIDHNGQTFYILELDGGGTKIFSSGASVVNELILISGVAEIANTRTFLLREDATVTGGSDNSYIDGKIFLSGTGDLLFPVGKNGNYAPIELLDVTGNNPVTGMEVFEPNPTSTPGFGVSEVSSVRYWQRTLATGTFNDAQVKISLNNESQITNINKSVVAESNAVGGEFESLGQQFNSGDGTNGSITSFDRSSATVFAAATELNEGRKSDSLALVKLYETNGGTDWTSNNSWLQAGQNLENWFGVTISGTTGRVTQLNLPDNNLTGVLTPQIRLLDELIALDLSGNNLSGAIPGQLNALTGINTINLSNNMLTSLPDLTALVALTSIDVSGNQLLFASLEPNRGLANINYDPQDSLSSTGGFFLFDRGQDFLLSVPQGSVNDTYQWFLNETVIAGATAREYQIIDLNRDNMGDYRCEVRNTLVTDLVLTSKVTTVLGKANISGSLIVSETEFLTAGEVRLLKVETGAYQVSQVKSLLPTGAYQFENVILGDYVVIADPFDKDTYLPTYHEQQIQWDQADIIPLNDDTTNVDVLVEIVPIPFTPDDGNGAVGGEIFTDFPEDEEGRIEARRRVRRVGVALRRRRSSGRVDNDFDDFDLVAYTETDDNGEFAFDNLPPGTYRIFIEFPGIPLDPDSFSEFVLGEDLDENEITVAATVFEDGIVIEKVEETGVPYDYLDELDIYPNPAVGGSLFVKVSARRGYEVRFELVDLRGMIVKSELLDSINLGNGIRKIDVSDLSSGIYVVKISVPSYQDQLYKVGKIIIQK